MTPFEEQLKQALSRKEPAHDFTARVLERVNQPRSSARSRPLRRAVPRRWAWRLAPAIAALLAVSGGALYREHQETVRGQAAKQQLLIAVRIAGSKLYRTQQQIREIDGYEVER